jgi:hypothetical protein
MNKVTRYWEKLASLKTDPTMIKAMMLRRGQYYTGTGDNEILEPSKPAGIDYSSGEPIMLHEGEMVDETTMGRQVTPARLVPFHTREQQMQAAMEEPNMRGMQVGGLIPNDKGAMAGFGSVGNMQQPATTQSFFQNQPLKAPQNIPGQTAISSNLIQFPTKPQPVIPQTNKLIGSTVQQQYKPDINTGLSILQNTATGKNSVFDQQANQALGTLGASQAAGNAAQQQQLAQSGVSKEVAGILGSNMNRQNALAQGQVSADMANKEAEAQISVGKDLINTSLGLDQLDFERTQAQIDQMLTLGGDENIAKAQNLASTLYGFDIDYSKAKLPDIQNTMANVENWINTYGADASPEMSQLMGKKYFDLWTQQNAIQGLNFTQEEKDAVMKGIASGDAESASSGLKIGSSMIDWWDNGEGSPLKLMLDGKAKEYQATLSNPKATSAQKTEASQALGSIIGTAYYAANGWTDSMSDAQKEMLNSAGLGMLTKAEVTDKAEAEATTTLVNDLINGSSNDWEAAYSNPNIWNAVKEKVPLLSTDTKSFSREKTAIGNRSDVSGIASWNAMPEGSAVNIGGEIYKVLPKTVNEKNKDYVVYNFRSLKDNRDYVVRGERDSGLQIKYTTNVPKLKDFVLDTVGLTQTGIDILQQ